jgi:hypothetical protein
MNCDRVVNVVLRGSVLCWVRIRFIWSVLYVGGQVGEVRVLEIEERMQYLSPRDSRL